MIKISLRPLDVLPSVTLNPSSLIESKCINKFLDPSKNPCAFCQLFQLQMLTFPCLLQIFKQNYDKIFSAQALITYEYSSPALKRYNCHSVQLPKTHTLLQSVAHLNLGRTFVLREMKQISVGGNLGDGRGWVWLIRAWGRTTCKWEEVFLNCSLAESAAPTCSLLPFASRAPCSLEFVEMVYIILLFNSGTVFTVCSTDRFRVHYPSVCITTFRDRLSAVASKTMFIISSRAGTCPTFVRYLFNSIYPPLRCWSPTAEMYFYHLNQSSRNHNDEVTDHRTSHWEIEGRLH